MPDVELLALTQAQRKTLLELIERAKSQIVGDFKIEQWRELESLRQAVEGDQ